MSATTKVDQAEQVIRELVSKGNAGEKLPRESDIAALAEVSRVTVREALSRLWLEGAIVRRWGRGTFIADRDTTADGDEPFRSIYAAIHGITSLPREIDRYGHSVAITGFQIDQERAPSWVRRAMTVETEAIWRVRRCLTIDQKPGVVMFDYLPAEVGKRQLNPTSLADVDVDLMSFLRSYGLRIVKHESSLSAVIGDGDVLNLLGKKDGAPVLRARQEAISDSGETVGCGEFFYNDDSFRTVLVRTAID